MGTEQIFEQISVQVWDLKKAKQLFDQHGSTAKPTATEFALIYVNRRSSLTGPFKYCPRLLYLYNETANIDNYDCLILIGDQLCQPKDFSL